MKLKKKLSLLAVGALLSLFLSACDFSEGVDHDFGYKAEQVFIEIDDDTMERKSSDGDDLANIDLLSVEADSDTELDFIASLEVMVTVQDKVISGDREALREYLTARKAAIKALGLTGWHAVPEFQFIEEDY